MAELNHPGPPRKRKFGLKKLILVIIGIVLAIVAIYFLILLVTAWI